MDYIKLYIAFAKVAFLTQLEYRGQYFVRILSKIISWSTGFIMVMVLLNKFKTIGDWTTYEVLFLYALDVLSYSIAGTFFMGSFGELPTLIRQGVFDGILTKPINSMLYLICTKVSAGYTSNYVISIIILFVCFQKLHISLSVVKIIWLIIVILGASLIQATGFMITAIPAFWIIKSDGLRGLFYSNITQFLQYPLSIYAKGIQILLTFILPYAFINYYPAQLFLGKSDSLFYPSFQYLTPIVGIFLFWLAYKFWKLGLNNYQSTGS
jgi:ABC-2 type transport system permease protein